MAYRPSLVTGCSRAQFGAELLQLSLRLLRLLRLLLHVSLQFALLSRYSSHLFLVLIRLPLHLLQTSTRLVRLETATTQTDMIIVA